MDSAKIDWSVAKRTDALHLPQTYTAEHYRTGSSSYPQRCGSYTQAISPRYSPYPMTPARSRRRSSTFSTESSCSVIDPSPDEQGWSSSHAAVNGRAQTQALSVTPSSRVPSFFTHSRTSEPPLFRTSERLKRLNEEQVAIADMNDLPKPPTITKVPDSAEARLEINGKVDSMTEGWTSDERNAKRRLVYFWRTQMEHVIYTNFAPWSSEARVPKERCISCFWWEKRQDYFVTSVDIIRLCGQLAGGNIVVGEKNRIRRNVDIYDKETIYKDHPDTEDIFSLVMGFTSPKPKNIEKAIKVFPWRNLGAAIVKVVNKWVRDSDVRCTERITTDKHALILVCRLLQYAFLSRLHRGP